MEDAAIIALFFSRDQRAIPETDKKYGALCSSISFRILQDKRDSEECVNDTYLKAWNTIPPQQPRSLSAYLGRIVRNLSLDRFRTKNAAKRGGGDALPFEELSECIPDTAQAQPVDPVLAECLDRWLDSLPKQQRVCFLRRYWPGEPLSEIAKRFDLPPERLAVTMHRLRKSLKRALEQSGIRS